MKLYDLTDYISFDLGLVSKYKYYTGVIFQAYTYGTGEPIVKGGRYDNLLARFGKDFAATGFAVVIDQLMSALSRQKIAIPVEADGRLVLYDASSRMQPSIWPYPCERMADRWSWCARPPGRLQRITGISPQKTATEKFMT